MNSQIPTALLGSGRLQQNHSSGAERAELHLSGEGHVVQDIGIDSQGRQRCWACGGQNFTQQRTARSKVGFGLSSLVTKPKLRCVRCNEYNDVGSARPYSGPASRKYKLEWEQERQQTLDTQERHPPVVSPSRDSGPAVPSLDIAREPDALMMDALERAQTSGFDDETVPAIYKQILDEALTSGSDEAIELATWSLAAAHLSGEGLALFSKCDPGSVEGLAVQVEGQQLLGLSTILQIKQLERELNNASPGALRTSQEALLESHQRSLESTRRLIVALRGKLERTQRKRR